jgi:hypothetical protein
MMVEKPMSMTTQNGSNLTFKVNPIRETQTKKWLMARTKTNLPIRRQSAVREPEKRK